MSSWWALCFPWDTCTLKIFLSSHFLWCSSFLHHFHSNEGFYWSCTERWKLSGCEVSEDGARVSAMFWTWIPIEKRVRSALGKAVKKANSCRSFPRTGQWVLRVGWHRRVLLGCAALLRTTEILETPGRVSVPPGLRTAIAGRSRCLHTPSVQHHRVTMCKTEQKGKGTQISQDLGNFFCCSPSQFLHKKTTPE